MRFVGRQRRALDVFGDHTERALRHVALDQQNAIARAKRGIEAIGIPSERDAPEVEVHRVHRLAVASHGKRFQVTERVARVRRRFVVRVDKPEARYESPATNAV